MTIADKWLIAATVAGPILGALAATGLISGVLRLARARARRIEHVDATAADLYRYGVPLTEQQFRDAYAAMRAELDQLPPPAERSVPDWERQYTAVNRFSMLTGTYPLAFPVLDEADSAWAYYVGYSNYMTRDVR